MYRNLDKKLLILFTLSLCVNISLIQATFDGKFVYITSLYNEQSKKRIDEYIKCLEKNLVHRLIKNVHVIYDTTSDSISKDSPVLNYLKSKNIKITYIKGRPTFGFCFSLANELYPYQNIILSNADIFFNETLSLLKDYDLTGKLLAITRWQVNSDGTLTPYMRKNNIPALNSQDTWIFNTPFHVSEKYNIEIGTVHCDNLLAYYARKSGLIVINPCLSIQCCHLHLSNVRNYNKAVPLPKVLEGFNYAPWQYLTKD
jgi:hypothetical protein